MKLKRNIPGFPPLHMDWRRKTINDVQLSPQQFTLFASVSGAYPRKVFHEELAWDMWEGEDEPEGRVQHHINILAFQAKEKLTPLGVIIKGCVGRNGGYVLEAVQ
jgi:hypothetical protein